MLRWVHNIITSYDYDAMHQTNTGVTRYEELENMVHIL